MQKTNQASCGITGTRQGMTPAQKTTLKRFLEEARVTKEWFVHGACVGVDLEAHALARDLGFKTECWPSNSQYAFVETMDEITHPKKHPLDRNKDIVASVSLIFVCPKERDEVVRSGTWATYRAAKARKVDRIIIWPDGTVKSELKEVKAPSADKNQVDWFESFLTRPLF